MALHERDVIRDETTVPLFGSGALRGRVPKYTFPLAESPSDDAFQLVADEMLLDGNSRQNLASFVAVNSEATSKDLSSNGMFSMNALITQSRYDHISR